MNRRVNLELTGVCYEDEMERLRRVRRAVDGDAGL